LEELGGTTINLRQFSQPSFRVSIGNSHISSKVRVASKEE